MYTKLYFDLPNNDLFTSRVLSLAQEDPRHNDGKIYPEKWIDEKNDLRKDEGRLCQFVLLRPDDQLYKVLSVTPSLWSQLKRNFYIKILRYNLTSANALSGCGKMILLSRIQFLKLVNVNNWCRRKFVTCLSEIMFSNQDPPLNSELSSKRINFESAHMAEDYEPSSHLKESFNGASKNEEWLDIGTGDSSILQRFLPKEYISRKVTAIEVNPQMISILRPICHRVLNFNFDLEGSIVNISSKVDLNRFGVLSLFNVLDRCYEPVSLLKHIHSLITPHQLLFLSIVLPFEPFVELEDGEQDAPLEVLMPKFDSFPQSVYYAITNCLKNFDVLTWSRVPYCCQGDMYQDYYSLDSVIMICRKK